MMGVSNEVACQETKIAKKWGTFVTAPNLSIIANLYTVTLVITIGNNILHCVLACHDGGQYGFAGKNYLILRRSLRSVL